VLRGERWRPADRALTGAALLCAAFFALSMLATLQPRGTGHLSIGSRDVLLFDGMRPSIWRGTLPTLSRHPITGSGYGTLVSETSDPRAFASPDAIPFLERPIKPRRLEAHDIWLSVLGQAGVVGLAAFLWLLYEILRRFKTLRQGPWPDRLPAALFGAVAGALVFHGLFNALEEARHLWALFGLVVAAGSRKLA
jgi:O-antigen ligase